MSWVTEPFAYDFMQRALLAGVLAGVVCALVGTWVVVRGLSFMGDALAHGVIPGIALAFSWGFDLVLGAVLSALVMIAGVSVVERRSRLGEDTGIGLLFVGMLALGVLIISRSTQYTGELTSFLFGNPLAVTGADLVLQAVVAVAVLVAVTAGYRAFLVLSFHDGKARVLGLRPGLTHVLLLGLIMAAVVSSFRSVGTLLVMGLLIGPPATATLVVRRLPAVMAVASAISCVCVTLGLVVSYHYDTAAGATMVVLSVVTFFVVLLGREVLDRTRRRVPAGAEAIPSPSAAGS